MRPNKRVSRRHLSTQANRQPLAKNIRKVVQITFAFKLRTITHAYALSAKDGAAVIVMLEHFIQSLNITRPVVVNRCSEFHKLFVPGFDLINKLIRVGAFTRRAKQLVLLFYDLVVARDCVEEARG